MESNVSNCTSNQNVEDVRRWIKENCQYHARQDDSFILRFLRVCKYDLKKTTDLLVAYYEIRSSYQNWFNWSPKSDKILAAFFKQPSFYVILHEVISAPTVCMIKLGNFDLSNYTLDNYIHGMVLMAETILEHPKVNSRDVHVVLDVTDISWTLSTNLRPQLMWGCSKLQMALPIGYEYVHVLNGNIYLKLVLSLLKCFMSKEFNNGITNHGSDITSFHKYISPEYLPSEYGGTAGPEQRFVDETYKIIKKGKRVQRHNNETYGKDKNREKPQDHEKLKKKGARSTAQKKLK